MGYTLFSKLLRHRLYIEFCLYFDFCLFNKSCIFIIWYLSDMGAINKNQYLKAVCMEKFNFLTQYKLKVHVSYLVSPYYNVATYNPIQQ